MDHYWIIMAPGVQVPKEQVRTIHRMRNSGMKLEEISRRVGLGASWISRLLSTTNSETGEKSDKKKRGRKPVDGLDNLLLLEVMMDYDPCNIRELTKRLEVECGIFASHTAVHHRVTQVFRYVKEVQDELTEKHKATRVSWCKKMLAILEKDPGFFNYWFSDESSFELLGHSGKVSLTGIRLLCQIYFTVTYLPQFATLTA